MSRLIRERFRQRADPFAAAFVSSAAEDARLVPYDLAGSRAHAAMLRAVGLLTAAELRAIRSAFDSIEREWRAGKRRLTTADEDVHLAVERWVTELAGAAGAKLHTGRSRNDQVALDLRLYVRDQIDALHAAIGALQHALLAQARKHTETVMPGYTHLQRAQPIVLAHQLLAWHDALARDAERLTDARRRVNICPLGAGALAGTSLPIQPRLVAKALGFDGVFTNSIDASADRDFAIEFVSAAALLQTHLSQIAETLILWATAEFGFVALPDALCTSSSMMPQKRNPDLLELVRAKTARVNAALVAVLGIVKALPPGYQRDLQEMKPPLFGAADVAAASLQAITLAVKGVRVNKEAMRRAAADPQLLATDLAELLVHKGVAFRTAHGAVARLMRHCAERNTSPAAMPLAQLRRFAPQFGPEIFRILTPEASVRRKRSPGSTNPAQVARRVARTARK